MLNLHTHHSVPWETVKYINVIGSGMLLQNAVEIHDTQRKRRGVGMEAPPMAPNKCQKVGEVKKTHHE
jgi:hypothetical protein